MSSKMSLQNKIFSIFIVVLTIGISFVGWYGYKAASESYIDSAYELSARNINNLTIEIEEKLGHVAKDTLYLKELYALHRYLIWKSMSEETRAKIWKDVFSDVMLDFLKAKQNYYKIRVLDMQGDELLTVKYDEITDSAYLVADSKLQNKSEKDYFTIPKMLQKDKFFISDMSLNLEYKKIEKPFVPVIRYSTPLISDNEDMIGIFVVNIYAHNVLDIMKEVSINEGQKSSSYFLIDKEGNYLFHKDENKMWGSQIKGKSNFNDDQFNLKKFMMDKSNGTFIHDSKIYSYRAVHPLKENSDNYWYVISSVDTDIALEKLDEFKQLFVLILLSVIVISFFIIKFYLLSITTPLAQVTSQLKALSRGEIKKEEINYSGNDEISEIVDSTKKVIDAIEATIFQANAVADGNFSKEIELLSRNDKLGLAITDMTKRLKEITSLAQKLSNGDYDTKIIAKSSEDKLGMALIDMMKYLQAVTNVSESIAEGNINVDYKIVGEDDRLGIAMLKMIAYLRKIVSQADAISKNDFSHNIEVKSKNDELSIALGIMNDMLKENDIKNKEEIYFSDGVGEFSDKLAGISDTMELAEKAITMASRYVGACSSVVYIYDKEKDELGFITSYSFCPKDDFSNVFKLGSGVVGQVALEKKPILLKNVKDNHYNVKMGATISKPKEVFIVPLVNEGMLFGVAELMTFESFTKIQKDYMLKAANIFSTLLLASTQNTKIKDLLEDSKRAYEELQIQSEELHESNVQMEEQQQQLTLQAKSMKIKNNELLQAKDNLDKRADDLEKAIKYKSEFLANMSHELRTPLNSIILLSKLLTQNNNKTLNDSDVAKTLVIHKAGNDLLLLINDILDLSKIETGNMQLNESEINTSEVEEEMQGLFGEVAKDKNLNFEIKDSFDGKFKVDKTKLFQVIKNLLSNAFKFTKLGEVSLNIFQKDEDIIFEIKDTGIGIAESKLTLVFEAFKQVDGSISREYGGTGLGLSISKTFVDMMGGCIEVQSKEGKGSSFLVALPLKKDNTVKRIAPMEKDTQIFDKELLKDKSILIVDDDSRNIFTISSIIEELGAQTYSALNGKDAIKFLEDEDAEMDIILMDIMMPIMDGLNTIQKIKSDERFKDIPIIVITAKTMKEDEKICYEAGANDYLTKPINQNALISMLKAWSK